MKNLFFFLLMAGLTSMMSCTAEKGDIGLTGPAGQDGIDGTNGQNGTNGNDGNANVKSFVTTISASDWNFFTSDLSYIDLQVPIITEQIAASGIAMVYWQGGLGEWYALPYSGGTQSFYFWIASGVVRIHSQNSEADPFPYAGSVRIVAISSEGLARYPDLDWTNYQAVSNALNLAD